MRCLELRSPCVSLKIIAHLRTFVSQSDSSIQWPHSINIYIYIYTLYFRTCFTTPCSSSCSVQAGLLNALLAGLPASSIKPLQLIQNAASRLIFNEPKRMHVTPLFINLHCNSCSHKIQGINVFLQNHLWLCTSSPKFLGLMCL